MEHAQRGRQLSSCSVLAISVLILILMEHAQRDIGISYCTKSGKEVLILILMEHAQRESIFYKTFCFNLLY